MREHRNYDLLRPFDLKKAKEGDAICTSNGIPCQFVGYVEGSQEYPVVVSIPSNTDGEESLSRFTEEGRSKEQTAFSIHMNPLFWCQGKPAYKGDILYDMYNGSPRRWNVSTYLGRVKLLNHSISYYLPREYTEVDEFFWGQPKTLNVSRAREVYLVLETLDKMSSKVGHIIFYGQAVIDPIIKLGTQGDIGVYKEDISTPIESYDSYLEFAKAYGFI